MVRRISRLLIIVLGGLGSACGDNEPSDVCASVTPTVTVEASGPVFDWSSECPAALLEVTPAHNADVLMWSLAADPGTNAIRGPVAYGVPPEGAAVGTPAEPLIPGQLYRFQLRRAVSFGLELMGAVDFNLP